MYNLTDERQFAVPVADIHAISDDENLRTIERSEVGRDIDCARVSLVEQHARHDAGSTARGDQILGERQRAAGFQDIVD